MRFFITALLLLLSHYALAQSKGVKIAVASPGERWLALVIGNEDTSLPTRSATR